MKKILTAMVAFAISFYGCKKRLVEQDSLPEKKRLSTGITIQNGHLSFLTASAYEQFLAMTGKEKFVQSLEGSGEFLSFINRKAGMQNQQARIFTGCEVPEELVADNPGFFSMINADGIVEISGTLYRYDYCRDRVWVISVANAANGSYYADFMAGEERTNIVGYFPTYVDAIEAVAQGYTTMPDPETVAGNEIFQNVSSGLLGTTMLENCFINNNEKDPKDQNIKMDGKLAYDKFAVYFHFYGKEKYQTRCFFNWCTSSNTDRNWRVNYLYKFRRKGRNYEETGYGQLSPAGFIQNETQKDYYSGSRGLVWGDGGWDVINMYTNKLLVERNGGSLWTVIANEFYSTFKNVNNYQFQTGTKPFLIHFD